MNVLVVAAHPDDEVLGCGGTIARLAQEGHNITIAIFGEGITSRYNQREAADQELLQAHRQRAQTVADLLGARELCLYDLPDNRFDSLPLLDVIKPVEELIDRIQPDTIYTHHGGDLNIDHVILHRATLTATRPVTGQTVKQIYTFEVPSSTEWAFQQFAPNFVPNTFVDIKDTMETKIAGMQVYESETRPFPHPRSPEALRAIARRWASVVGLDYAEAFQLVRSIW